MHQPNAGVAPHLRLNVIHIIRQYGQQKIQVNVLAFYLADV
ncbi:MAG: hypothetical protein V7K43_14155 [Nostoc sp.]